MSEARQGMTGGAMPASGAEYAPPILLPPGPSGIGCERLDLNQRPQGYEPCELPGCSTPHGKSSRKCSGGEARGEANSKSSAGR